VVLGAENFGIKLAQNVGRVVRQRSIEVKMKQEFQSAKRLITDASAAEFVGAMLRDISMHSAVRHEYLVKLSEGNLPNIDSALMDYAFNYSRYSNDFTSYLRAIIAKLDNDSHRSRLMENLIEEEGDINAVKLEKKPHSQIFNHFKKSIGVTQAYENKRDVCDYVIEWHKKFGELCSCENICVGLGAIGFGTEIIVPEIYQYFISAIENHSSFDNEHSLFFRLHVDCDEDHAKDLLLVITDFANSIENRQSLLHGAEVALSARSLFWDAMLARALAEGYPLKSKLNA